MKHNKLLGLFTVILLFSMAGLASVKADSIVGSNPTGNGNQWSEWYNMYNVVGTVWCSGQFTGDGSVLTSCTFQMTNYIMFDFSNPSPTGYIRAVCFNSSNDLVAVGDPVNVATMVWTMNPDLYNFTFNGAYVLQNGANYIVGLEITSALNNVLAFRATYNVWAAVGSLSSDALGSHLGAGSSFSTEYAPIYYVWGAPAPTPTPSPTPTPTPTPSPTPTPTPTPTTSPTPTPTPTPTPSPTPTPHHGGGTAFTSPTPTPDSSTSPFPISSDLPVTPVSVKLTGVEIFIVFAFVACWIACTLFLLSKRR